MFRKNKKEIDEIKETIAKVITPSKRPFLERKEDITDLRTLTNRVQYLYEEIEREKSHIRSLEDDLANFKTLNMDMSVTVGPRDHSFCLHANSWKNTYDQCRAAVSEILCNQIESRIKYSKELIHTCEDEIDWLNARIMNPQLGVSKIALNLRKL